MSNIRQGWGNPITLFDEKNVIRYHDGSVSNISHISSFDDRDVWFNYDIYNQLNYSKSLRPNYDYEIDFDYDLNGNRTMETVSDPSSWWKKDVTACGGTWSLTPVLTE